MSTNFHDLLHTVRGTLSCLKEDLEKLRELKLKQTQPKLTGES